MKGLDREGRWFCFAWLTLGLFYSPSCLQCIVQHVTPISALHRVNSAFISVCLFFPPDLAAGYIQAIATKSLRHLQEGIRSCLIASTKQADDKGSLKISWEQELLAVRTSHEDTPADKRYGHLANLALSTSFKLCA